MSQIPVVHEIKSVNKSILNPSATKTPRVHPDLNQQSNTFQLCCHLTHGCFVLCMRWPFGKIHLAIWRAKSFRWQLLMKIVMFLQVGGACPRPLELLFSEDIDGADNRQFAQNFCGLEALDRCQQLLLVASGAARCHVVHTASHNGDCLLRFRRETHLLSQHGRKDNLVDSPIIPCRQMVVCLICRIFLVRAIIFLCRGVHCLSVDVGFRVFRTVVDGAVPFPSTCLATDVTNYLQNGAAQACLASSLPRGW